MEQVDFESSFHLPAGWLRKLTQGEYVARTARVIVLGETVNLFDTGTVTIQGKNQDRSGKSWV